MERWVVEKKHGRYRRCRWQEGEMESVNDGSWESLYSIISYIAWYDIVVQY